MNLPLPAIDAGRAAILLAVLLQATGKVAYGTFLGAIPSPVFVFVSLSITAALFLLLSRKGAGERAWKQLLLLNAATAITFLSFFQALKLIEPAIAVAINIGVGPLLAVLIAWFARGERPGGHRLVVCAGILAGCAMLCLAATRGSGFAADARSAWLGLGASAVAGLGATTVAVASKSLLERGWQSGAILAHRFYLVIPAALLLSVGMDAFAIAWSPSLVIVLLVVTLLSALAPLYLFQIGIRRTDPYTVMVTMSAMPVITFLIEGLSPAYRWSWATAAGLAVLTAFLLLDMTRKKPA